MVFRYQFYLQKSNHSLSLTQVGDLFLVSKQYQRQEMPFLISWFSSAISAEIFDRIRGFDQLIKGNGSWQDLRLWRGRSFDRRLCERHFRVTCGCSDGVLGRDADGLLLITTYIRIYIYVYVYMYIYICIYIYTYIFMQYCSNISWYCGIMDTYLDQNLFVDF